MRVRQPALATAAQKVPTTSAAPTKTAINPCKSVTCIPLAVHLWAANTRDKAPDLADQQRALTHARRQLAWANARFAALKVRFVPTSLRSLRPAEKTLNGAKARDEVGRARWQRGAALWIGPHALVDLDGHTERHGVHWRDRADQRGELVRKRWVIVLPQSLHLCAG